MKKLKYLFGVVMIVLGLTACREQSDTQENTRSDIQISEDSQVEKEIEIGYPLPDSASNQPTFLDTYINSEDKLEIFACDVLTNDKVVFEKYVLQDDNKWEKTICDWSSKISIKKDELITSVKVNCEAGKIFFNIGSRVEGNGGGIFIWDENKSEYSKMELPDIGDEHEEELGQATVRDSKGNNVLVRLSENYSVVVDLLTNTVLSEFDVDTSFAHISEDSLFVYREGALREYSIIHGKEQGSYPLESQKTEDVKMCVTGEGVYLINGKGIHLWEYGSSQIDMKMSAGETEKLGNKNVYIFQILVDKDSNIYYTFLDKGNLSSESGGGNIYKINATNN